MCLASASQHDFLHLNRRSCDRVKWIADLLGQLESTSDVSALAAIREAVFVSTNAPCLVGRWSMIKALAYQVVAGLLAVGVAFRDGHGGRARWPVSTYCGMHADPI